MRSVLSRQLTVNSTIGGKKGLWQKIRKHLNFYRVHIIFFTFTPLICSGIFYASNGRYKISYIDSLFNCVSAMTVCGLATVDLSSLTGWQQTILFLQMCMGSPVVVSWVMVFIRKYYFARKFEHIIEAEAVKKAASVVEDAVEKRRPWPRRIATYLRGNRLTTVAEESNENSEKVEKGGIIRKLRPDMIRRMDDAPKLVNPSGWVTERPLSIRKAPTIQSRPESIRKSSVDTSTSNSDIHDVRRINPGGNSSSSGKLPRRLSDPGISSRPPSPVSTPIHRYDTVADGPKNPSPRTRGFPRVQTVEFAPSPIRRGRAEQPRIPEYTPFHPGIEQTTDGKSIRRSSLVPQVSITTHVTSQSHPTHFSKNSKNQGFGGFPTPFGILKSIFAKLFPKLQRQLTRTVTIPATMSLVSRRDSTAAGVKHVPYISFDAVVGRNSTFHLLTSDQLEEIGGVEYRALNALLWIVAVYHIGVQLFCFVIIAPYISTAKWSNIFLPPQQLRPLVPAWFSAFQVVSSYTNTGMSLVDQSMLPFQRAYPMVILMVFLILAGNTAFPIFLRFMIWIITKLVPNSSRVNETLHFLLDHPRRCFIYLFPSHQTWFLFTIVLSLTFIDWFSFMVLDIGNPAIEQIPLNVRFLAGFLQAVAVRAAGFGIVPLSALAPAVKVLYVIMMYISVYPIAMSVRSTNVYEEQSLGIFSNHDEEEDEDDFEPTGPRITVWSRYLALHARRQLAFDMWWLGLALFLVCIIERGNIDDQATSSWFNIFTILFELVSAYGTVGLSLGIPTENYSLSGAFRPLSKLIVCIVMLRGRHRGLPVAIDRAVMLPSEFEKAPEGVVGEEGISSQPQQTQSFEAPVSHGSLHSQTFDDSVSEQQSRKRMSHRPSISEDIY